MRGPGGRRTTLIGSGAILAVIALVALQFSGGSGWLRRDDIWARVQREHVVRVGMDASYLPFETVDAEGRFQGLDVDLAQELGKRWGVQVRFVNVHFDGLYDALKVNKFDLIISALPYDRTMTRDLAYSTSYLNVGQVLLVRQQGNMVQSFADLAGKRVAVELGTEAHQLVRSLARDQGLSVDVVPLRESPEVAAQLVAGSVDAAVCDRVTAIDYLRQHPELQLAGPPLTDAPLVIATRRDAPVLLEQVNLALEQWQSEGVLDTLMARWF